MNMIDKISSFKFFDALYYMNGFLENPDHTRLFELNKKYCKYD